MPPPRPQTDSVSGRFSMEQTESRTRPTIAWTRNGVIPKLCKVMPVPRQFGCILYFGLALAVCLDGFGQASFSTNGGQYNLLSRPGDQIRAQLGLNPAGGYLVWEDNSIDGRGQGVGALALNNNFTAVGGAFRVNQIGAYDQEHPQVALLNNGAGAVFAWQGGVRTINQHIFARFLSSSPATNFWLAGDVLVNTVTNTFQ